MADNTTPFSTYPTTNSTQCLTLQTQSQDFIPWNNADNILDQQIPDTMFKLQTFVIWPITVLIGMATNVINMVVFYKHGLQERINVCLFALSLADGLYIVFTIPIAGEQFYLMSTTGEQFGLITEWIMNHYLHGVLAVMWVSQVLSAIVACERCFCILKPLKSQTILRTSTVTTIIVAVFIVVTGLRFIVVTRYHIVCAYDPVSDKIIRTMSASKFYTMHRQLVDILDTVVYALGISWVVIVVVVSTTVVTVVKLRQATEWRAGMSSSSGSVSARDIALTRMLVGNSIFFIACALPMNLFSVSVMIVPEMNAGRRYHNFFFVGLRISNILSIINAAFNIVIYYTMGTRYRQTVHNLLRRKITKDAPNKTSVSVEKTVSIIT